MSNPSGLRPRRGKDFWFLARSENLRLASSSPVGTFSPNREPVTTALGAGAGAPTPNFVWSSPVGGANIVRTPKASPWGFLLYTFLWLEPVTPRAYALGGITVFTSSRARKNRHPAVSSPEQQRIVKGSKGASPCKNVPCKNVKSNAPKSSPPPRATHPLGA